MYMPHDPMTLFALFLGKDSSMMLIIIAIVMLYQNRDGFSSLWRSIRHYNLATLTLEGRIVNDVRHANQYSNFSPALKALIHRLNMSKPHDIYSSVKSAAYYKLTNDETDDYIETVLPLDNTHGMKLTPDITLFARIRQGATSRAQPAHTINGEEREYSETIIYIDLKTKKPLSHIHEFLKVCQTDYETYLENEAHKTMIIRPEINDGGFLTSQLLPIPQFKTFDNMFFESKAAILKRLDAFRNKGMYERLGIPDSLGMLFYGEPGTGKTSAIKAIANYMNMNIIIVPMNSITTRRQLEMLFYKRKAGTDYKIPYDKRIYVFEEIDCNGWDNVVRDRVILKAEAKEQAAANAAAIAARGGAIPYPSDDGSSRPNKKKYKEEPLTLGAFLEILDGIVELPGRIIIMTTNNPNCLDAALKRPGRIDMMVEFKRLRAIDIANTYERWCGQVFPASQLSQVKDYKFTQADVSQIIFKHENDPDGFVAELVELCQGEVEMPDLEADIYPSSE
jgi:ATPase family associated with various cellular activities (AAA)